MKFLFVVVCLITFMLPVWGQERAITFDVSVLANWTRWELSGDTGFNLAQAGFRLPTGRYQGEETLRQAFPQLLQPYLLSLRVDSSSTIRDLVDRGDMGLAELYNISREAVRTTPHLSRDLSSMTNSFTIGLERISAVLIRHRNVNEVMRPIIPVQTPDYTGIIIIAADPLPLHGRRSSALLEPCLFPKIWDTEMNLIFDMSMFQGRESNLIVRYAAPQDIFRPTPSGMDTELSAFTGSNPLRIIARGAFGANPTDPVIDRSDALLILSSENNRRLLREGRIVLVLDENQVINNR